MKVKHNGEEKLVANINTSTLHAIFFSSMCWNWERSRSCHPEKKEEGKFPFHVAGFYRFFFHSIFICVHFCTFMHIILNEMSQEKYLPFAHKFFPSFSVQIPDVVNIARLSHTQKNLLVQAFQSMFLEYGYMLVLVPSNFSNECRL